MVRTPLSNMMKSLKQFLILPTFAVFGMAATAADVSVAINPKSFPLTEAAQLSVTISGGNVQSRPAPATPEGVAVRPYGQSTNMQIINGQVSRSLSLTYIVTAEREGTFTIPPFDVVVDGQTVKTEPLTFSVTSSAAVPSLPATGGQGNSGGVSPNSGATANTNADAYGSLRLEIPKRDREHLYVGEMAPARIKAFFPAGARISLNSAPRPEGQGFTLHNLSEQPEQNVEVINGQQFRTLTWYAGISTAKAGEYPLTVSLDASVAVRQKSASGGKRRQSPFRSMFGGGNSPFDDPFFDQFFNGSGFDDMFSPTVQKDITLTSPGAPLEVRSLPDEGKPENFSGAVGKFTMGGFKLPADATTGEPQQIRVTVDGKGNFDRMTAPNLQPAEAWKAYTPRTNFTPKDVAAFSGSKSFEFSAVPQKGGDQTVTLGFSYFDPETAKYEIVTSPSINLTVAGEDVKTKEELVAEVTPPRNAESSNSEELTTDLAPQRLLSTSSSSLIPLIHQPLYWVAIGFSTVSILAGFVIGSIRRHRNNPERLANRETEKAANHALSEADSAVQKGEVSEFFQTARKALQTRLASAWNCPAEAITLAEIRTRFPADSPIVEIFRRADSIAYAPSHTFTPPELRQWQSTLHRAFDSLAQPA